MTIWTSHFVQPTGAKCFWGLFPFEHQYNPVYHQFRYFHTSVLFSSVETGLFLTKLKQQDSLPDTCLENYCKQTRPSNGTQTMDVKNISRFLEGK